MIARLFAVEVRRLLYRRATRIMALVVVAVTLLTFVQVFRTSRDLSDAEVQRLRNETVSQIGIGGGPGFPPSDVEPPPGAEPLEGPPPQVEEPPFGEEEFFFDDPRFVFAREMPELVLAMGVLVLVAAFAFGATAGGADWSSGTVQALLFWEPRRVRVILCKVAAVAALAFGASIAVELLSVGLGSVTASLRGNFDGVDGQFWQELAGRSLRMGALAIFTSLLAFGIAGFTRNTGAALGVAFVYFAVLENVIRGFRPRLMPYLVTENIGAWVRDGMEILIPLRRPPFSEQFYNSGTRAATVLLVYLLIVVGGMTATFARRDVT